MSIGAPTGSPSNRFAPQQSVEVNLARMGIPSRVAQEECLRTKAVGLWPPAHNGTPGDRKRVLPHQRSVHAARRAGFTGLREQPFFSSPDLKDAEISYFELGVSMSA